MATAGVLLQMGMMYFFGGVNKWTPPWHDGTALGLVLSNPNITRPLGKMLAGVALIPQILTWLTLAAEIVLPFVLFSPWRTTMLRSWAVLMLMAMHLGIQVTMKVMMFSLVAVTGLACFVPTAWWDAFPLHRLALLLDKIWPSPTKFVEPEPASPRCGSLGTMAHRLLALSLIVVLTLVIAYCLAYNTIDCFAHRGPRNACRGGNKPGLP